VAAFGALAAESLQIKVCAGARVVHADWCVPCDLHALIVIALHHMLTLDVWHYHRAWHPQMCALGCRCMQPALRCGPQSVATLTRRCGGLPVSGSWP
jgi:hypothetical protein